MRRGLVGATISVQTLPDQLDTIAPVREQLETQITAMADQLLAYVLTFPGVDAVRAMSLFGETQPIETFNSADELVAFAGLDLTVYAVAENGVRHTCG